MNLARVSEMDSVLGDLTSLDQELAQRVIDAMIRFEELAEADSRSLQTLVRNVDGSTLMMALVGVQRPVRDAFLKSMSCRARGRFLDDMDNMGAIRRSDIEAARKEITRIARRLSNENRFALPSAGYIV
ncbi:MAG: hypothetical protein O2981_01600 [Proteobacteria bacterium]|nr:hypothetical protein [Pseudomonadota bacterium]